MRFYALLCHDVQSHIRRKSEWAVLVLFFLIVIFLLPFAIGPDPDLLRRLAAGLIWLAALLMSLLALDKLFIADAEDGTLDMMLLSPVSMALIVFSKLLAQSLTVLAALAVMMVPAALLLNLDWELLPVLLASFLLGIPSMVFLGGIIGAVTVALPRHPALLTLLLVPFYMPILIFAVSACDQAASGGSFRADFLFLGAILALLLPSAPFIISATLRQGQG